MIRLASTFSPNGTNSCVGFLPCSLSNVVFPSRPFWHLDRMHPACSTNHGMTGESSLSGSFDIALGCSDNSTQSHYRVLNESIQLFVSFHCVLRGNFCVAHCSYMISERDYCRLCVALQRDFAITKQVNEFDHSLDCPGLFNSLLQRHAAHDVLVSVVLHRDARNRFFWDRLDIRGRFHFHEEIIHGDNGPS